MIVPQRRGELESFSPEVRELATDAEASEEYSVFERNREQMQIKKFLSPYVPELEGYTKDWERQYYKGLAPSGRAAPEHQVKRQLAEFSHDEG